MSQNQILVQLRDRVLEIDVCFLELCPQLKTCFSLQENCLNLSYFSQSAFQVFIEYLHL